MNEAWILSSEDKVELDIAVPGDVESHEETYENGQVKCRWSSTVGSDGRYYLHGLEEHFFEEGQPMYRADWAMGHKQGQETLWSPTNQVRWERQHMDNGKVRWTQYWSDGTKKSETVWKGMIADGPAKTWDNHGGIVRDIFFTEGVPDVLLPEPSHLPSFPEF